MIQQCDTLDPTWGDSRQQKYFEHIPCPLGCRGSIQLDKRLSVLSASPFARHVGIVLCELYYFGCEVQCDIEPGRDLLVDLIIDEADSAASRVDNQDRK